MKCDLCDKYEATIVYTHIVGNDKKTLHLCSACIAQQHGAQSAPPGGQSAAIHVGYLAEEPSSARCSCCGMRYEEFRKTGRLGCGECYAAFAAPLAPLLKRIHGAERHVGKGRIEAQAPPLPEEELAQLHRELERAVKEEAYERAAELRDRIAQTEEEMEMGEGAP